MLDGVVTEPDEQYRTATIINAEAERMQRLVLRMNQKLAQQGKRYSDLGQREFESLVCESMD